MRWQRGKRSDNVVDARGKGGVGGKLSLGAIVLVVVLGLLSGQDPLHILGQVGGEIVRQQVQAPAASTQPVSGTEEQVEFVRAILGDTEETWQQIFAQAGQRYQEPKLVLFSGGVRSACGFASSAVGPFYCPGDNQVYIDLAFFKEMEQRFAAAGDFAQAYVIAHEVGHHVQTLLGISEQVNRARRSGQKVEGDGGLLVRQELQADCFAGVWAHHGQRRHQWLEAGDLEEALNAASAIGDDRLQKQAQGQVIPDAFTHGTSAQRVRWFKQGFESGDVARCDTFKAARL